MQTCLHHCTYACVKYVATPLTQFNLRAQVDTNICVTLLQRIAVPVKAGMMLSLLASKHLAAGTR